MRHVGKLKQTDTRCVVVMMQIPNREDHALIVESDSLPDHYHQHIMSCLESREGQANPNFGEELGRRQIFIADRGNMTILQALHEARFLRPVHIDKIMMTPTPGTAYPLRQVLESMGRIVPGGESSVLDPNVAKFNPHLHNANLKSAEDKLSTAQGIISQAQYLELDAKRLREQAYAISPELRPAPTPVYNEMSSPAPVVKRGKGRPKGSTKKVDSK